MESSGCPSHGASQPASARIQREVRPQHRGRARRHWRATLRPIRLRELSSAKKNIFTAVHSRASSRPSCCMTKIDGDGFRGGRLLLTVVRPGADPTAKARTRCPQSECDMSENHRQETNAQSPAISKYGGTRTDKRAMDTIPFAQRLSCTVAEACAATALGRAKLYELIGAGAVATTLIGRRRLVSAKSLLHLIAPEASAQIRG